MYQNYQDDTYNRLRQRGLEIKYNYFNLPKYIKFNNYVTRLGGDVYSNTTYSYQADGVKIRKVHHYFSGRNMTEFFKTTEYIDGFSIRQPAVWTYRT